MTYLDLRLASLALTIARAWSAVRVRLDFFPPLAPIFWKYFRKDLFIIGAVFNLKIGVDSIKRVTGDRDVLADRLAPIHFYKFGAFKHFYSVQINRLHSAGQRVKGFINFGFHFGFLSSLWLNRSGDRFDFHDFRCSVSAFLHELFSSDGIGEVGADKPADSVITGFLVVVIAILNFVHFILLLVAHALFGFTVHDWNITQAAYVVNRV